jgi:hypothetical protein
MIISRFQIFLFLFLISVAPFFIQKAVWILKSKRTNGTMWFAGSTMELQSISSHAVIVFISGKDSIIFNGRLEQKLKEGSIIAVRYQVANPHDAKIDSFASLWGDTLIFALYPCLALLVILLTTIFIEPVVPRQFRLSIPKHFFRR